MIQPSSSEYLSPSGSGTYNLLEIGKKLSSGTGLNSDSLVPDAAVDSNHLHYHRDKKSNSLEMDSYWDQFDGDLIIDIGVIYTPEALTLVGNSPAAMISKIHLANDEGNIILENSQVSLRTRLVFIKPTDDPNFEEPGNTAEDFKQLLYWLRNKNDGKLEEAHTYREEYKADVVVLVNECPAYAGIAFVNVYFSESYAFGTYNVRYLNGHVWAHELGHIQGCYHDLFSGSRFWDPEYEGYGNCWEDASKGDCTCYSSVMVYDCNTEPNHCTRCTDRPFYANKNVMNAGSPTGTTQASCGFLINENRRSPISFRNSIYNAGIINSVYPSAVFKTACVTVTIEGWMIGYDSTITKVTLAGKPAVILQSSLHRVTVQSPSVNSASSVAGDVVVMTSSGRVTELKGVFSFISRRTIESTDWSKGILTSPWRDTGDCGWTTSIDEGRWAITKKKAERTNEVAELTTTELFKSQTGVSCYDTLESISFEYWAYSPAQYCYGQFTVAAKSVTGAWTNVWEGLTFRKALTNPWVPVSITLPSDTREVKIRLTQQDSPYAPCASYTPLSLSDIVITKTSDCDGERTCLDNPAQTNNKKKKKKRVKKPSSSPTRKPVTGVTSKPTRKRRNRKNKKKRKRKNKNKNKKKNKTNTPTTAL
eukprot:CAMPEP_0182430118 /NCGR_PEP_ID=MMETSP1167-20130531/37089_1 /TAXON_ID=2988 /ORGANISM="Mallomonas Sp, Strain CCMP3275" /LENGTH=647 /DNA_ID=CAMNT_0024614807 /DNA_START=509 /DNA_END=2452 /DNA_ORIENTATION=+